MKIWIDLEGYKYFKRYGRPLHYNDTGEARAKKFVSNETMDKIIAHPAEDNNEIVYLTSINW
jgi:hypothetical protein